MEPSTVTLKPRLGLLRISSDGPYIDLEFAIEDSSSSRRTSCSSDHELFFNIKRSVNSSNKPLATKFRYFMLRFKNHIIPPSRHHHKVEPEEEEEEEQEQEQFRSSSSSSSSSSCDTNTDTIKKHCTGKEVIHKYLSKIKPLYVRVSKLRFPGQLSTPSTDDHKFSSPVANIRRRLRKCRSASAAVAAVPSPPPRRRGDSLVRHHEEDGIESAIEHCKRSFSSDKGSDLGLVRSRSDPGGRWPAEPK